MAVRPLHAHVNPLMRAWAAPPTLHIAGLRVKERVYVRATHYARHRCAQNADHLAHNTPFSAFFAEVVCVLGAAPPQAATSQPQNGGNDAIQASDTPVTRRQRASHDAKPPSQPASCATSPTRPGRRADWREKTRPTPPLQPRFREKLARHAINRQFWAIVRAQGELLRARIHHQTQQGEKCRTLGMETRAS